jgi:glycosyltransferase 2 family protein
VDADSPPPSARRRSRWLTVAVLAVVAGFFVATLAARWNDVISMKWRLEPGLFILATVLLALSYGLVALLWSLALHRAAGTRPAAGARIWFLSNLARYVPGNVWSYVGAVELARREGVARRTTLAVMALTQVLSVGVALLVGLPVLLAERARLGRPALLGVGVVLAAAALAAIFRRQLLGLARRRLPGLDPADLTPSAGTVALLTVGYAAYWAVTGVAFAALVASLYPLDPTDVPVVVAAYAAAYAVGFLALLTPAGLGVREGVLVVALAPVLPAGPALVVALLSRLWMMLVELAGAAITHLIARPPTSAGRAGTEAKEHGHPGGGG